MGSYVHCAGMRFHDVYKLNTNTERKGEGYGYVCLSVCLSVCWLSVWLIVWLFVCQSLYVSLPACLPTYLPAAACLSVSLCLSVCLTRSPRTFIRASHRNIKSYFTSWKLFAPSSKFRLQWLLNTEFYLQIKFMLFTRAEHTIEKTVAFSTPVSTRQARNAWGHDRLLATKTKRLPFYDSEKILWQNLLAGYLSASLF